MEIISDALRNQFKTEVEGHLAHVAYRIENGALDIRHTIVPEEIKGDGHCVCFGKSSL